MQLETELQNRGCVHVNELIPGECFSYTGSLWMLVRPSGFIKKSTVLSDVVERGDVFAVRLRDGNMTAWTRTTLVTKVNILAKLIP